MGNFVTVKKASLHVDSITAQADSVVCSCTCVCSCTILVLRYYSFFQQQRDALEALPGEAAKKGRKGHKPKHQKDRVAVVLRIRVAIIPMPGHPLNKRHLTV